MSKLLRALRECKSPGQAHLATTSKSAELSELAFDNICMEDRKTTGLPSIAAKDRAPGIFQAQLLDRKGRSDNARIDCVGWRRGLSYKRVIARSDTGPSIMALLRDVRNHSMLDVESVEEAFQEGDHQQNGEAELSVRDQARLVTSDLEARSQRRLQADEPILAWLVRHAAHAIHRERIGPGGTTPRRSR